MTTSPPGEGSDILGGPEPDEEGADVLGGPRPTTDELGGPEPDEEGSDLLGGPHGDIRPWLRAYRSALSELSTPLGPVSSACGVAWSVICSC